MSLAYLWKGEIRLDQKSGGGSGLRFLTFMHLTVGQSHKWGRQERG